MAPEKFPEQASHPVAPHRFAEPFRHHQPQPRPFPGAWGQSDAEMPGIKPSSLGPGPEKFAPVQKAIRLGETGGPGGIKGQPGSGAPAAFRRMAQESSPAVTRSGVYGLWPGGASISAALPWCSCGSKSHGCGPGANCWVEMYVSCVIILKSPDFSKLFIKHLSPSLSRARKFPVPSSK